MKRFVFLAFSFVFAITFSFAQYGGAGYYQVGGFYFTKVPVANANLTGVSNTLPVMGPITGGGGYAVVKGIVLGGRGYGSVGLLKKVKNADVSYKFTGGQFDLGYVFLSKKKISSFAYLGIGGTHYGILVENNTQDVIDFGTLQSPPNSDVSFVYSSFTISPGLNFTLNFKILSVGLDVSYVYPIKGNYSALLASLQISVGGIVPKK